MSYTYDRNGNRTSLTPPGRTAHTFAYTAADSSRRTRRRRWAATQKATRYAFDNDELLDAAHARGATRPSRSDATPRAASNRSRRRAARRASRTAPIARSTSASAPGGEAIAYAYDGPLLTRTAFTGTVSGTVANTYDSDLRIVSEQVGGSPVATYGYDDDSLLTHAGDLSLTRDPQNGLVTATSIGASTTALLRNAFGEPDSVSAMQGASAVYDETYTRDSLGRISTKTESRPGGSRTIAYSYDSADRLAGVTQDGVLQATYTYDANGNRSRVDRPSQLPRIAAYDAQDRLTSDGATDYTYTDDGELSAKRDTGSSAMTGFVYDALGALTRVTLPDATQIDYVTDPAQRRIGKKRDGALVQGFLYGRAAGPVAELNPDGSLKSRFVYATRSHVPEYMVRERDDVQDRAPISSAAPCRRSTSARARSLRRSTTTSSVASTRDTNPGFQPFRVRRRPLRPRHEPGPIRRARLRPRDRALHRQRPDQLRRGGDTNLYGYALQDPVNFVDPSGLFLDTLLDIGFIAYDLYSIGKSLANGCGVSGTDLLALGADVAGAAIPFATGGGAAVRAARAAEKGSAHVTEGIYHVVTKEGLPYVGQSNNIERRLAEHVASGKITQEAADKALRTEVLGGKTAREVAEQRRINELTNGVGARDPGIANKVNPIGPKRQHLLRP